jgi:putative glutamine amidotransferase
LTGKPLIGVTGSSRGGQTMWLFNRLALWRAGARAARITADGPVRLEGLQGVVIGGGDDIDAALYGASLQPTVRVDPERDRLELRVLDRALERGLPVLGICRGAQMLNVHRGGSLHPDIHAVYVEAPRMRTPLPRKTVRVERGSHLHAMLGGLDRCRVNALHHQSVDRVGQGLRVVACDEAGIVQAIESDADGFRLGVQWHPEFLVLDRRQQGLFRALAEAARGVAAP